MGDLSDSGLPGAGPVAVAEFLDRHLRVFNEAVVSGDFEPLVNLFTPQARLEFAGVPYGPFVGRKAIGEAYAEAPPTDTMTVLDRELGADGVVVEGFSWSRDKGRRSGEMRLRVAGDRIQHLHVRFAG